jgi:hypothetical protein
LGGPSLAHTQGHSADIRRAGLVAGGQDWVISGACWIGPYAAALRLAEANRQSGVIGMTYIWTIYRRNAMRKYIDLVVGAIITNNPWRLVEVLEKKHIELAMPRSAINKATSDAIVPRNTRN